MPTWVQWISFLLAIIGSFTGVFALRLNYKKTRLIIESEEERKTQLKKAVFKIARSKEMGNRKMKDVLLIDNTGHHDAENVNAKAYKIDSDNKHLKKELNIFFMPVPETIVSGQTVKIPLDISLNQSPPFEITITWDDELMVGNTKTFTIT